MWWLGLFFEHLALDLAEGGPPDGAARAGSSADPDGSPDANAGSGTDPASPAGSCVRAAIALCSQQCILDVNEPARDQGIGIGMKRATALALAPSLQLIDRDPEAERHALETVAVWMQQFTPTTSLQSGPAYAGLDETPVPCGLVAEVGPSLRYFGGLRILYAHVRDGLRALGWRVRIGVAPTAGAAWLLARHRNASFAPPERLEERIGALPVQLLAQTRAQRDLFQAIGVQQVHELLALPRAAVARRFGPALLDGLDQALGRRPEPRRWFTTPPAFHQRLELFGRIEHAQALFLAAQRLLASLTGWLRARRSAVRTCTLHIEHEGCADTRIDIELASPADEDTRLSVLLREKLAVTRLPEAARALRLQAGKIVALPETGTELFPSPRSAQEELHRVLERLQARLGNGQVRRVQVVADHRPEAAWRFETIDAGTLTGRHDGPPEPSRPKANPPSSPVGSTLPKNECAISGAGCDLPFAALPRPLWLLDPPLPLAERNHRPWWRSALQLQAGPERIESGWWDGRLVQRDYFIASDDAHLLYWIYRERLQTGERQAWFLHGRFG